jgi:ribosome maturation factor RimP
MAIVDRVRELVAPIVHAESVELYDIEHNGSVLRILVDAENGIDISVIKRISREVSRLLDDVDPIPGRYTLEVSSPGLERPLRTPAHFSKAVGSDVNIKTHPDATGERRVRGTLMAADDRGFDVETASGMRRVSYGDVTKARTVFEWGPTPKKGGKRPSPGPSNTFSDTSLPDTSLPDTKAPTS